MNYTKSYQLLITKLNNFRRNESLNNLIISISKWTIFLFSILITISFVELSARGDSQFRFLLFTSLLVITGLSLLLLIAKPIINYFNIGNKIQVTDLALRIGNSFSEIKDRMSNAIQLFPLVSKSNSDNDLALLAFNDIWKNVEPLDLNKIIDKKKKNKWLLKSSFSVILALILLNFNIFGLGSSFSRVMDYDTSYLPPIPFTLEMSGGDISVLRGDDVEIIVSGKGDLPSKINLNLKEEKQDKFDQISLSSNDDSTFIYTFKSIKHSYELMASANFLTQTIKTKSLNIRVLDRPLVKSFLASLRSPRYTKLRNISVSDSRPDFSAMQGSVFSFELNSSKEIDSAFFIFEPTQSFSREITLDTLVLALESDGFIASGKVEINYSGNYYFKIKDKDGIENLNPIKNKIIAQVDEYPEVELIQPSMDLTLSDDLILALRASANDDFGVSKVSLGYRLSYSKYTEPDTDFTSIDIPIYSNDLPLELNYIWDLNDLGISPEDNYEFFVEVWDNDGYLGSKSARSKLISVRLPSLQEVFAESEDKQKGIQKELTKLAKESQELKNEIEELRHDLRKNHKKKKLDWEEKKRAENINRKKEELKEKVEELSEKLEQSTEKLEENNLLSPETLQKYKELQELMKEISTENMRQESKKINDELEKMSPKELQKLLEKQKFSEEQFLAQIERTMKMLKKLEAEQKVDKISQKAKKMEEKQNEISKKLDESSNKKDKNKLEEESKKQNDLKNDMQKMEEDIKDLARDIKNLKDEDLLQELEKALQELQPDQAKKQMEESAEQMKQGQKQQAKQNQKKTSKQLSKFAQKMQQMKNKMQQNQNEKTKNGLRKAMNDMTELSKQQESLRKETSEMNPNSTRLPDIQRKQSDIQDGLKSVASSLSKLSEESMAVTPKMGKEIGKAMSEAKKAQQELAERRVSRSSSAQKNAMSSMNKAAGSMGDMLEQMGENQGSGSCSSPGGQNPSGDGDGSSPGGSQPSFSQQLGQAAAQQQMIQQSMQRMLQGMQEGKYGEGKSDGRGGKRGKQGRLKQEYGELKDRIGTAQKSLQEMENEQKNFANTNNDKTLQELREIRQELAEVMSDVESGSITKQTMARQDKIMSRMLDAIRSVNKRDFSKKRKSREGRDYKMAGANEKLSEEELKKLLRDRLRKAQSKYSKDYRKIIKEYYKKLEESEVQ